MRRLLIVQPGQKLPELERVPGEFADWVSTGMGLAPGQWEVRYPQRGDELPADPAAAVVTGSGAMGAEITSLRTNRLAARERARVFICRPHLHALSVR